MKYDLYINDTIGWPISAGYVRSVMAKLDPKDECAVYINSFGGSVSDGLDIRQQFIDHGNVTAYIHGMTASSATILAMGAKRIVMGRYSFLLVHRCSKWQDEWGQMNATELGQVIERLQKTQTDLKTIDDVVSQIYADRSGKTRKEMLQAMDDAYWLTAEQALELGLIDDILEEDKPAEMTASESARIVACGLPMPAHQVSANETPEKRGLLATLQKQVAELITSFRGEAQPLQQTEQSPKTTMNNSFTNINTVLSVEGFDASEGKVTLTEEQMKTLEDHLASAKTSEKEKTEKLEALEKEKGELQAKVEAFGKADGDDTPEVRNEGKEPEAYGMHSALEQYKALKGVI